MNEAAGRAANAASKCWASTAFTPCSASSRVLAGASVSRNGPVSGTKKPRGCGSKVKASSGAPSSAAFLARMCKKRLVAAMHAVEIAERPPRRPSTPPAPNASRRTPEPCDRSGRVASRHQHDGFAVDHDLVAVQALGLQRHRRRFSSMVMVATAVIVSPIRTGAIAVHGLGNVDRARPRQLRRSRSR